jgi:hypothetical protein
MKFKAKREVNLSYRVSARMDYIEQ